MSTPFGPQLIGETEKTLNALLHRFLRGTGLNEAQWVTLRLAGLLDGSGAPMTWPPPWLTALTSPMQSVSSMS